MAYLEWQNEVVYCHASYSAISTDLERPLTQISKARSYANIFPIWSMIATSTCDFQIFQFGSEWVKPFNAQRSLVVFQSGKQINLYQDLTVLKS